MTDVTPPIVQYCPRDLDVDSFHDDETAYVDWSPPTFFDNSGADLKVISTKSPGYFSSRIHNVTYTAIDSGGNKASCSFLISVTKMGSFIFLFL